MAVSYNEQWKKALRYANVELNALVANNRDI